MTSTLKYNQVDAREIDSVQQSMNGGVILCREQNDSFDYEGQLHGERVEEGKGDISTKPRTTYWGSFEIVTSENVVMGEITHVQSTVFGFILKGVLAEDPICQSDTSKGLANITFRVGCHVGNEGTFQTKKIDGQFTTGQIPRPLPPCHHDDDSP